MTSKWIEEAHNNFYRNNEMGDLDSLDEVLYKIDKLLRRAMFSTDSERLHDDIEKEINGNRYK